MSFVGPRPDVPGYADKLTGYERDVLRLRPGITGPASLRYSNEEDILAKQKDPIAYNNNIIYPDKVKLNLDYYNNNSIWLDIKIIFATIFKNFY
jgi:lipopolysaccharide/colanic/teichoic acid biosynthesis glycosyltransferase